MWKESREFAVNMLDRKHSALGFLFLLFFFVLFLLIISFLFLYVRLITESFFFVCLCACLYGACRSVCLSVSISVCLSICLPFCLALPPLLYVNYPPTPSPASLPVTAALEKTTFGAGSRVRPPRRDDLPPLPLTKQSPVISIAPIATEATRALPAQSSSPNSRFFRRAVEPYFCLLVC